MCLKLNPLGPHCSSLADGTAQAPGDGQLKKFDACAGSGKPLPFSMIEACCSDGHAPPVWDGIYLSVSI